MHTAKRHHDFSAGHRVHGHESKCANLHGHNYRVTFSVTAQLSLPNSPHPGLDPVGRVIDFSEIKTRLCDWLEENWDHKMLLWVDDPFYRYLVELDGLGTLGIVGIPFNPTAENMAQYLAEVVGPEQLQGTGIYLTSVDVEETRKCSVRYDAGMTLIEGVTGDFVNPVEIPPHTEREEEP